MTTILSSKFSVRKTIAQILGFFLIILFFVFALNMFPTIVYAADGGTSVAGENSQPVDVCQVIGGCLGGIDAYKDETAVGGVFKLIQDLISIATFIAVPIGIVFIIFGGYQMITSQGDEKKYASGLETVKYAVFGLIFVILSTTIIAIISTIFNGTIQSTPPAATPPPALPEDGSIGI